MDEVLKTFMRPRFLIFVPFTFACSYCLSSFIIAIVSDIGGSFLKAERFRERDRHGDIIINLLHCQSFILLLLLLSFSFYYCRCFATLLLPDHRIWKHSDELGSNLRVTARECVKRIKSKVGRTLN